MSQLVGKVVVVTGGGRNLGKAFVQRFLDEGATVVIADIDEVAGKETAEEFAPLGPVTALQTDVTDRQSTDAMAASVIDEHGRIDVLVNNAGIWGGVFTTPDEKVTAVNVRGVWTTTASVAKEMVKRLAGKIVNIASIGAYAYVQPGPAVEPPDDWELPGFAYPWSKWSVIGLSRFMAGALGPFGVNVNCVCPGVTLTESTTSQIPAEVLAGRVGLTALKRACQPEDIAGAVVFLSSDDANLITGQNINVDAGMNMRGS